jgi:2-(1,2-epoxy-1,2-dihydrophenyl)acetyl-CoA isomerase
MDEKTVLYTSENHVALIVLIRPEFMNVSSIRLRADLIEAIDLADKNDEVRVVVFAGEGRAFGAGADLSESFHAQHASVTEHILKDHKPIIDRLVQSPKTYIAALNGATAGISLASALACDLVIMAEDAYLLSPFASIGLIPGGGTSWFLLPALGYRPPIR